MTGHRSLGSWWFSPGATVRLGMAVSCAILTMSCNTPETLACSDLSDMSVGASPEVRLLVLYSEQSAAASEDIEADIEVAVLEANVAMQESGVSVRFVLAHMAQVSIADGDGEQNMRDVLTAGTGSLAIAHTLRDTYHADVVGIIGEFPAGSTWPMMDPSLAARDKAFFAAGRTPMNGRLTLAHEMGHLLGAAHHRPALGTPPRYRYAYPRTCTTCKVNGIEDWQTIMGGDGTFARIARFSNPEVLFPDDIVAEGVPTGAPTSATEPEDNHKTLYNTAGLVAFFRITPAWFASTRAVGPWFEKRAADDLVTDLRFADIDGDGESDAFKVDATTNTWYLSRSAAGPWEKLRVDADAIPIKDLRLADFDGDGTADVFRVDLATGEWFVSWKGTSSWTLLNATAASSKIPVTELAFGRFDTGPTTDVFWSDAANGAWHMSAGGQGPWTPLNTPDPTFKYLTSELRLGDFDGDAISDVFRIDVGATTWHWSRSGASVWQPLNGPNAEFDVPVTGVVLGDFDGDGITDVLKPNGSAWGMSSTGSKPFELFKLSCVTADKLATGDFDGDRATDVIRSGVRP